MGRAAADRVGRPRIARDRHRLAAAAAIVDVAALAALAGLGQKVGAAKLVEGRALVPDPRQRGRPHIVEAEPGNRRRRMAGQHGAVGGDIQPGRAPAVHAGLWKIGEIIRGNEVDGQFPGIVAPRLRDHALGLIHLFAGGLQGGAVLQRPALELHTGNLDPPRAKLVGQRDGLRQIAQIVAVHHRVQGQRQADAGDLGRDLHLAVEAAAIAADEIRHPRVHPLQGQLHMVEPGGVELVQPRTRKPDPRGDQVGIKPRIPRRRDDGHQIGTRGGFPARDMQLQHPQRGSLAEHLGPLRGGQFAVAGRQFQRVRAIGTGQRAAMGQLGQHRQRRRGGRADGLRGRGAG